MPFTTDLFYNNSIYKLLSNSIIYSNEVLQELNTILHDQPELVECNHLIEGSFFHIICRRSSPLEKYRNIYLLNRICINSWYFLFNSTAYRMIYALSNAGGDPNITDDKGNTPLHEAIIRGSSYCGLDLIQVFYLN